MRLFVSYARLDKPYCIQIIQFLSAHEVWFDQRFYAGERWWDEILRRLEWCEGFIYLLSPASIASEYCQREFSLAVQLQRHIFPILIHDQTTIPDDIAALHYVDLTRGITPEATAMLLNSIHRAEMRTRPKQVSLESVPRAQTELPVVNSASVISVAAAAMEKGQFDQAVFLFKQAKSKNFTSRFINIDKLLKEAERQLEDQTRVAQRDLDYRQIAALINVRATREMGCEALTEFSKEYPKYDPDGLLGLCGGASVNGSAISVVSVNGTGSHNGSSPAGKIAPKSSESAPRLTAALDAKPVTAPALTAQSVTGAPSSPAASGTAPNTVAAPSILIAPAESSPFTLPMLEFVRIPEGNVTVEDTDANGTRRLKTFHVPAFDISRYPVTNTQFQAFIDDPNGYKGTKWWDYSPEAKAWHAEHANGSEPRFQGENRPRETVNWFDSLAFCNWLSEKTGDAICLPTTEQWYRAAKGDTDNRYPWGVEFDKEACNTRESELKMTTPVTRYEKGVSPFGIWDMAGNVWEWTLSTQDTSGGSAVTGDVERAVHGGAYVGTYDRARIPFRYYLKPAVSYATIGFRLVRLAK